MKKLLAIFSMIFLCTMAANANEVNESGNNRHTIRLVYPQWQGGNIAGFIPELKPEDASRGYILGAELLNFLAPKTDDKTIIVPISDEISRTEEKGIMGYTSVLKQTKDAVKILDKENPDRIVVLGGECSVSVVPFTYLAKKYQNDVALVWIDAHPDMTLPEDKTYNGYHAMAVTAIMGKGDKTILSELPAKIDPDRILFVGLRDWERQQIVDRQTEYGIKHLSVEDISKDSAKAIEWIRSTGAKHVVIHYDLDVLDPDEMIAAVGVVPKGMKIAEVVRLINDINKETDVVGLTIAEPMPRLAIRIRNMLNALPLLK